jgi:hypothetical protein
VLVLDRAPADRVDAMVQSMLAEANRIVTAPPSGGGRRR